MHATTTVPALTGPSFELLRGLTEAPPADPRQALVDFLGRRNANTVRAYGGDLEAFRSWLAVGTLDDAAAVLCAAHPRKLRDLALAFARAQREAGRSVATSLRRVSTLRSLLAAMRRAGVTSNTLDLDALELREAVGRRGPSRNTSGPGLDAVASLVRAAGSQADATLAARDVAVVWLLAGVGLRRAELASLTLADVDLTGDRARVFVLGKGRDEREAMTLPPQVAAALRSWLAVRPVVDCAALLVNLDRATFGRPVTSSTVYGTMRRLAAAAGVDPARARPHGLRHAFGSLAARATGGDAFKVRTAMRHASVTTSLLYVDADRDEQGRTASAVAATIAAAL